MLCSSGASGRIGVSSAGSAFRISSGEAGACSKSDGSSWAIGLLLKTPSSSSAVPYCVSGRTLTVAGGIGSSTCVGTVVRFGIMPGACGETIAPGAGITLPVIDPAIVLPISLLFGGDLRKVDQIGGRGPNVFEPGR